jgi:S1-C subfamily serine protease
MVIDVVRNSPAAKAGILQKDVIVEFAGVPIRTYSDLPRHIERLPTDQPHALRLLREGEFVNLSVQLSPVKE